MAAHHRATAHATHSDEAALAELLDLDGEVLAAYLTDAMTWVHRTVGTAGIRRVLDLGAGTGTGTIALAQRFLDAEVIAVDASELMLARIRAKASERGLIARVRTVHCDLDDGWPAFDDVDVAWASLSLHHLGDPDRVLGELFAALRPGGLLAVAEISDPLRFLADDIGLGRPGLEARCLDALRDEHAHAVPDLATQWGPRIECAGFTPVGERTFGIDLSPPYPPATIRYARHWLRRLRTGVADRLSREDVAALDRVIDSDEPQGLCIRGSRTVMLARRPGQ